MNIVINKTLTTALIICEYYTYHYSEYRWNDPIFYTPQNESFLANLVLYGINLIMTSVPCACKH